MAKEEMNIGKLDGFQEELNEIKEDAMDYAEEAAEEGRCKFRKLKKDLSGKTDELIDDITSVLEKYKDSGREVVHKVEDKIIEKPITSLLIALAAGLIIGRILENRKH